MRRRSKADGEPVKAQRRKTAGRKRRIAPKGVRRRGSSAAGEETAVARLTRERDESLEQQAATAEVLKALSRSTFDLQTVLDTLLESAARLCEARRGVMARRDGDSYRGVAFYNASPEIIDFVKRHPIKPGRHTITARVALERRTIHVADLQADPEYKYVRRDVDPIRTELGVPMFRGNDLVGVIILYKLVVQPFTDKQIELVTTFADQAVIAIENARLFEAEQQRTRELAESLEQQTATSEVLQVISSSPGDLEPIFATMLENAVRICDAKWGTMHRWDGDGLPLTATHKVPLAFAAARRREQLYHPHPESLFGRIIASKAVVHTINSTAERVYVERLDPVYVAAVELGGVRTVLGVPMVKENELIGAFAVARLDVRPFTDKQIELIQNFAAQAVIAIENARLLSELRESLQQQTATADVLKVISRSTFDLQSVLNTLIESVSRLCKAEMAAITSQNGDTWRLAASYGYSSEIIEYMAQHPIPLGRGSITGRVLMEGRTVHVPDVMADPEYGYKGGAKVGGINTMLGIPLVREGTPIGVMVLQRRARSPFTDKQIELAETFADQAVIAIENVRLFEAEQQRTRELTESLEQQTATSKVLDVISRSAFDLKAVFETVAESSVRLCGAHRAFIYRFDGELLRLAVAYNTPREFKEFVEQNPIRPGRHSCAARAALECRTIHIPDILADPEYTYGARAFFPTESATVLGVPILKGADLLGVMIIYHEEVRPFTDNQIALVETFADQAAIAIENVRLLDELRQRTTELGRSVEELRALGEVSQAVNSTLNLETVLSTIVAKAAQLSGTEAGAIYVYDNRQREFHLAGHLWHGSGVD